MDEEDDDFYAPNGDAQVKSEVSAIKDEHSNGAAVAIQDEDMDASDNDNENGQENDEDDEDEDDSDIDIITERQDGAVPEPPPQARPFRGIKPELPRTASVDAAAASSTPRPQQPTTLKSDPSAATTKKVAVSLKDGSTYPEIRTSSIDVNSLPVWSPAGKLITEVDIDADLAEHTKPWRLPGTDQTDYFNYGFDEFTWTQYCLRQQNMSTAINAQKQETKQFEMMLAGQPGPAGAGGQPAPMPMGMPGMPDMPPDMMNAMFASMQAQNVNDPSQLDFGSFMQQMSAMGGGMPAMPGMSGQAGQSGPGGQGAYGGQPMQPQNSTQGYGGQQHAQSSYPQQQAAQGFGGGTPQPQSQGQQGFEGYSAQQLAMIQGGGGAPQGPGGGRGRGRGRRW